MLMCLRGQLPKVDFSPEGSTSELEECEVNLDYVASLQSVIKPDLPHNKAIATLAACARHKHVARGLRLKSIFPLANEPRT